MRKKRAPMFRPIVTSPSLAIRRTRSARSAIRKRGARYRNRKRGISPTVPLKTGPGVVSTARYLRHRKLKLRRRKKTVRVRTVTRPGNGWTYTVHFKTPARSGSDQGKASHGVLIDFIKQSMSGQYKLTKFKETTYYSSFWVANVLKLQDEADLLCLMLCHSDMVFKVLKYSK
jgi:hypothetical protein